MLMAEKVTQADLKHHLAKVMVEEVLIPEVRVTLVETKVQDRIKIVLLDMVKVVMVEKDKVHLHREVEPEVNLATKEGATVETIEEANLAEKVKEVVEALEIHKVNLNQVKEQNQGKVEVENLTKEELAKAKTKRKVKMLAKARM